MNCFEFRIRRFRMYIFVIFVSIVIGKLQIAAQESISSPEQNKTIQWDVTFEDASIDAMIYHPEVILKDVEGFWERDRTYRLVAFWHQLRNRPINFDYFRGYTQRISDMTGEQRTNLPFFGLKNKLMSFSMKEKQMVGI